MKSSEAAIRIDPPNSRMKVMNRYELMLGAISLEMIFQVRTPLSLARSTKSRVRSENVWALIALAAHGQEVSPMNSACTPTLRTPR